MSNRCPTNVINESCRCKANAVGDFYSDQRTARSVLECASATCGPYRLIQHTYRARSHRRQIDARRTQSHTRSCTHTTRPARSTSRCPSLAGMRNLSLSTHVPRDTYGTVGAWPSIFVSPIHLSITQRATTQRMIRSKLPSPFVCCSVEAPGVCAN